MTGLMDYDEGKKSERRSHVCHDCGTVFDADQPEWMVLRCNRCRKRSGKPQIVADDPIDAPKYRRMFDRDTP